MIAHRVLGTLFDSSDASAFPHYHPENMTMRVLVVDDHEIVRRGVSSLIKGQPNYEVCGEAVDGQDAVEKARELNPNVIVMDVSMPRLNGLEATQLIRASLPDSEILILSQHDSSEMMRQAFKAGARGYVVKSSIARDLLAALDSVSHHKPFFDQAIFEGDRATHIDSKEILQRSAALEQALRESEELYRSTFELAAVGVAHVSPEGRFLRVNDKLCQITGYRRDQLLKMTFHDITHPDDVGEDVAQGERVKAGELDTYLMEKRYVRKDGTIVWVHLTVSAVRNASGKMKHFISVVEDIGSRRDGEEARNRLAAIVESSDDAIISKGLNGIIASWNAGAERIFGFTAEEAIGRPITIIIPPELRDEEKEIISRLRNGERIDHYETVRVSKSGEKRNISLTVSPVRDSTGKVTGASKVARDITERKRLREAEEARRISEARLELALEASKAAFFEWDMERSRGKWNSQMTSIYGFTPAGEEITAEEWRSLFHADDLARLLKEADEVYRTKDDFQFEYRAVRPDRKLRWILSQGRILRDAHGKALQMIGIHADITQQKLAEEALHREEQQFRVLADSIAELCWMANPDGYLFWYNQRWYDYTGTTLEQMKGDGWKSVQDAAVLPNVLEKWNESMRTGQPFEMVFPLRAADGTFRPFLTRVRPLKDEKGSVLRWFGTNTDIASQMRIEEALRHSEARLRAAFTQTYSLLALLTLEGTIFEVNEAALGAAGGKREEVIGRKFWEPWWTPLPEEVARLKDSIVRSAKGEVVQEECYFCLPDGSRRFAHRTLTPVRDDGGNVTMIVATGLDLTEQKELRDDLEVRVKQRTQELEEKNQALLEQAETVRELSGRLLRAQDEERRRIARDLHDSSGQILAAVQMNLTPLEVEARNLNSNFAKGLQQSIGLVEQLSKELRTVSYLLHPPLLEEAGLPVALRWYVEGFAERSNIDVQLEVSPELGRLPGDMEMTIFRIVQESLTNIHRHAGSKAAKIRMVRSAEEIRLEIQDNGRGMPSSNNGRSPAKHVRAGVGIQGMRERVKQLGGRLEIQSNENGTAVNVSLPLTAPVER
jgi:PAS domain S-box-containing protein